MMTLRKQNKHNFNEAECEKSFLISLQNPFQLNNQLTFKYTLNNQFTEFSFYNQFPEFYQLCVTLILHAQHIISQRA